MENAAGGYAVASVIGGLVVAILSLIQSTFFGGKKEIREMKQDQIADKKAQDENMREKAQSVCDSNQKGIERMIRENDKALNERLDEVVKNFYHEIATINLTMGEINGKLDIIKENSDSDRMVKIIKEALR